MRARGRVQVLVAVLAALLVVPFGPSTPARAADSTTVIVTASANPSTYGADVTFTAIVETVPPGGIPTGTVQFQVDGVDRGVAVDLVAGSATSAPIAGLAVGNHVITAVYTSLDETAFVGSTGTLTDGQEVVAATLTVTPSPLTVAYGAPEPAYPFGVGGWQLGEDETTAAGYVAPTCDSDYTPTTSVADSPRPIACAAGAAANYTFDVSATGSLTITKASQAITFSTVPPAGARVGGMPYTPAATAAGGPVTFSLSGGSSGVCALAAGVVSFVGAGTCTILADQAGNANYDAAPQVSQAFTVSAADPTTTAVASSINPSSFGQGVTFTATVSSGGGTPTGSVQFTVDGAALGSPVALVAGSATSAATTSLAVGNHAVAADFTSDDPVMYAASSGILAGGQEVVKAQQAALSITGPATKTYGDAPFAPGTIGGSGTGAITFTSSTPAVCTASGSALVAIVAAGTCSITATKAGDADYEPTIPSAAFDIAVSPRLLTVTATGVAKVYDGSAAATVTLADDRIAGDSLVLAYAGASFDNPNAASSKPVTVVGISVAGGAAAGSYTLANTTADATAGILAASTAASVGTSVNPVPATAPVTLTARVTWPGGAPSGSVVFRDGSTPIGGPVALANGTATLITSFATAGNRDITAAYVPDSANFAASTSAVFTQTVGRSSVTLDLAADRATWETGVPLTLTARLTPAATGVTVALTGSVAFRIDGALVATVAVAGGAAAHRATLAAGPHAIVATFIPDAAGSIAYDGSESAPLVRTVVANAVAASGIGLSGSTVYPYRDTWRDTVTIQGSRAEPLAVTIRIYRPSGSLLTTRTIAAGSGAYASAWNGRTSGGTILPAGRYRVVQTLTDPSSVPPLVRSWTSYVTLSTRRMAWTTVSLYRDANAPARWSGAPSRLSSSRYRTGARLITPSSMPGGWAAFGYQFTLPSATTIRSVAFFVQGGPWSGPAAPKIGLHDWRAGGDWAAMYDGARTRRAVGTSTSSWYGIAGDPAVVVKSISGRRYVRAFVDTGGYVAGFRYELGRVRLVVTYGVLK